MMPSYLTYMPTAEACKCTWIMLLSKILCHCWTLGERFIEQFSATRLLIRCKYNIAALRWKDSEHFSPCCSRPLWSMILFMCVIKSPVFCLRYNHSSIHSLTSEKSHEYLTYSRGEQSVVNSPCSSFLHDSQWALNLLSQLEGGVQ